MSFATLGVIGGGAWGTALAQVAAADGIPTLIWAREAEVVAAINASHANPLFLPGIVLSPAIEAIARLDDLGSVDALLVVTPAQVMARVLANLTAQTPRPLILCAKGFGPGGHSIADIAAAALPGWPIAILSGPTFAAEVARGLPTAVTLACADETLGRALCDRLARPAFRPYWSRDITGACVGGAVKNVLAIACGVVAGRSLGDNARAAVITRGFAEMLRYGLALGAEAATLGGLSGLGDLVLTCTGTASRNFNLGVALGQGGTAHDLLHGSLTVAEGALTAPILAAAATTRRIDMPIVDAVAELLNGSINVEATIANMINRPLKAE